MRRHYLTNVVDHNTLQIICFYFQFEFNTSWIDFFYNLHKKSKKIFQSWFKEMIWFCKLSQDQWNKITFTTCELQYTQNWVLISVLSLNTFQRKLVKMLERAMYKSVHSQSREQNFFALFLWDFDLDEWTMAKWEVYGVLIVKQKAIAMNLPSWTPSFTLNIYFKCCRSRDVWVVMDKINDYVYDATSLSSFLDIVYCLTI